MIRVYVAGPYGSDDNQIPVNVRAAIDAAEHLLRLGFNPFVPHLYHHWNAVHPHDYETWMSLDLEWLQTCNAVLRIPGDSPGADIETKWAETLDIPVFHSMEDIEARYLGTRGGKAVS